MLEGTLIAAFITRDSIHLFSDGRVINRETRQISNTHSKVHHLSAHCGMLVAGVYMPALPTAVSRIAAERRQAFADQVAPIVRQEMRASWQILEHREAPERIRQARAFAFVTGFDAHELPRLFYVDNRSVPSFALQERPLFGRGCNLEIGAMSTGSGELEDLSAMFTSEIQARLPLQATLAQVLEESFDCVKNRLAGQYESIGGRGFRSTIYDLRLLIESALE
jgi:hypothetical protein